MGRGLEVEAGGEEALGQGGRNGEASAVVVGIGREAGVEITTGVAAEERTEVAEEMIGETVEAEEMVGETVVAEGMIERMTGETVVTEEMLKEA